MVENECTSFEVGMNPELADSRRGASVAGMQAGVGGVGGGSAGGEEVSLKQQEADRWGHQSPS